MPRSKGKIALKLWWGTKEATSSKIWPETERLKTVFNAAEGHEMSPFTGKVTIYTPDALSDEEVLGTLRKEYPDKKIGKSGARFTIDF